MRSTVRFLAVSLLLATPALAQQSPRAETRPPAITLQKFDGGELDLGTYIGRSPVLLHFFAAWCSQCRAQMPSLHEAVKRYGSRVRFVGVAVSANQSLERARRYAQAHRMTHELVYDGQGTAVDAYDVPTTSYVVVIDRGGRVVFTGSGPDLDIVAAAARGLR